MATCTLHLFLLATILTEFCSGVHGDTTRLSNININIVNPDGEDKTGVSKTTSQPAGNGDVLLLSKHNGTTHSYGVTGCTHEFLMDGNCWRYCQGGTGDWCFTSNSCSLVTCDTYALCSYDCYATAVEGCVSSCGV